MSGDDYLDLITADVDPCEIAEIVQVNIDSAIAAEKKSMEGMTVSDARAWIDRKTHSLQQSMMALTAIRNTLASINKLPDEMLVEIFWCIALIVPSDFACSPATIPNASLSWLPISKVCRRWRNIVVGTPKLYSSIDARNSWIVRLFLARSYQAPLDIYMPSDRSLPHIYSVMTDIMSHIRRVRTFDIRVRRQSILAFLKHVESSPAPTLESLHLEQTALRRVLSTHETIIVSTIFGDQTPALRRVHLSLVSIPWTSSIYTGLTDLELLMQHELSSPTIETFLEVLQNCPLLKSLVLVHAGPTLDIDILECPSPFQVVKLAHLEIFVSQLNRPINNQYILSHMIIPPHATITIRCMLDHSDQNLSDVLPQDCTGLNGLEKIRRLRLYVEDVQSIYLTAFTHDHSIVLSLVLESYDGMLKPRRIFSQFRRFFPLLHLEELQIVNCAAFMSKDNFVEVLSELPNLTSLTAIETTQARQRSLLAALAMRNNGEVVCPRMELLQLSGLDTHPQVMNAITNTCLYRASNGAALKAIHIAGLDDERVSSLLQAGVSIIDVDDTWVNQDLFEKQTQWYF